MGVTVWLGGIAVGDTGVQADKAIMPATRIGDIALAALTLDSPVLGHENDTPERV